MLRSGLRRCFWPHDAKHDTPDINTKKIRIGILVMNTNFTRIGILLMNTNLIRIGILDLNTI